VSDDLLIQLLRDAAPTPRPEFTRSLDTRVAHGFRAPAASAERDPVWPWEPVLWRLGAAVRRSTWVRGSLAVAASTLLVLAVVTATAPTDSGDDSKLAHKQGRDAGLQALGPDDYSTVPLADDKVVNEELRATKEQLVRGEDGAYAADRDVSYHGGSTTTASVSATITDYRRYLLGSGLFLTTTLKQVPDVIADSTNVARKLGGYPGSSTFDVEDGEASGSADLWVPTDRYADAIARLSKLGDVERTVQHSRDITASRADLAGQIRDDAARVRDMERAGAPDDDPQLQALRNQLELRRQRLADVDRRVEMTLINLRVRGVTPKPKVYERWTIDWAVHEGGDLVGRMGAALILLGAALLLPGSIALVAWIAWRANRRRLRGRALDDD
jgi:hypothetical protein